MDPRHHRAALAAAVALGLVLPAGSLAHEPTGSGRTALPPVTAARLAVVRDAPDFTLVDDAGRSLRLSDLRGQVVLISFVYLSCPTACPLITQRLALLHRELSRTGRTPGRVTLLSITVDPKRDDAAALARYARAVGADGRGWRFLREEPSRLSPVLAAFDEWTRRAPGGDVDHPARLHLIDGRGLVREIYSLAFFEPRQARVDLESLLRE